jgi:hypothetical protein
MIFHSQFFGIPSGMNCRLQEFDHAKYIHRCRAERRGLAPSFVIVRRPSAKMEMNCS